MEYRLPENRYRINSKFRVLNFSVQDEISYIITVSLPITLCQFLVSSYFPGVVSVRMDVPHYKPGQLKYQGVSGKSGEGRNNVSLFSLYHKQNNYTL